MSLIGNEDRTVMVEEFESCWLSDVREELANDVTIEIFDFHHGVFVERIVTVEWIEEDGQKRDGRFEMMTRLSPAFGSADFELTTTMPENENIVASSTQKVRGTHGRTGTRVNRPVHDGTIIP